MEKFIQKFPWLASIPDSIREHLDYDEFFYPDDNLVICLRRFERAYAVNTMVYNRFAGGRPYEGRIHLCSIVNSAVLSDRAVNTVRQIEAGYKDEAIRIVAYKDPVEYRQILGERKKQSGVLTQVD